jgi:hypothetical protein
MGNKNALKHGLYAHAAKAQRPQLQFETSNDRRACLLAVAVGLSYTNLSRATRVLSPRWCSSVAKGARGRAVLLG